jgi:hypothetical protein
MYTKFSTCTHVRLATNACRAGFDSHTKFSTKFSIVALWGRIPKTKVGMVGCKLAAVVTSWSRHLFMETCSFFQEAFHVITFRKWPAGPKNALERQVSQFYTVCDKNRLRNKNIGKVMAILVLRCQKLLNALAKIYLSLCRVL